MKNNKVDSRDKQTNQGAKKSQLPKGKGDPKLQGSKKQEKPKDEKTPPTQ